MMVYIVLSALFVTLAGADETGLPAEANAPAEVPDLTCYTFNGRYYRGTLSMTTHGRTCQAWSAQTPHSHRPWHRRSKLPADNGLKENYCRNPVGVRAMPWCYTTDLKQRWEYCQVKPCAVAPELDCYTFDGRHYRGTLDETTSGYMCHDWSARKGSRTKEYYPYSGLDRNFCRNPDGGRRPWCYSAAPGKVWEYCDVPACPLTSELNCYTSDGRYYRGDVARTIAGETCQSWSKQRPWQHGYTSENYPDKGLDENYCRNPDGAAMPWCYTTDSTDGRKRWEYCDVDTCDAAPDVTCYTGDGRDFRGMVAKTISGKTCQHWSGQTPHKHDRTPENHPDKGLEMNNYCRNPDNGKLPWCYTTDPMKRWEYCQIPACPVALELICYTGDGKDFRGKVSRTVTGKICQSWSAQTPHSHPFMSEYILKEGLDENYCRNPDGEPSPWCYTTDPLTLFELCPIHNCEVTRPKVPPVPPVLTEAEIIVNKHNQLRRGVQPTASNMLKMEWSVEAAAIAKKWADMCTLVHSEPVIRTISTSVCGENLFFSSTESTWDAAIQSWYDEVNDWEYGKGAVGEAETGHFTQVVWYRSNQIGCAMAHCPGKEWEYYYVCQYCPAGNIRSSLTRPYMLGPSCDDCPNACEDKLCTNACPYSDKYTNCNELKESYGGCDALGANFIDSCPASCKCTMGEI